LLEKRLVGRFGIVVGLFQNLLDGEEPPVGLWLGNGWFGDTLDDPVHLQLARRHEVAARHQGVAFSVGERVEIGADGGEEPLHLLEHAIARPEFGFLDGRRVVAGEPVHRGNVKVFREVNEHQPAQ
jgi:hypothetical protein